MSICWASPDGGHVLTLTPLGCLKILPKVWGSLQGLGMFKDSVKLYQTFKRIFKDTFNDSVKGLGAFKDTVRGL